MDMVEVSYFSLKKQESANKYQPMPHIMLSAHIALENIYTTYYKEHNYHGFLNGKTDIFYLSLRLYNYWAQKEKIKIKGVRKIVVEFFDRPGSYTNPPDPILGAIMRCGRFLDFEKLKTMDDIVEQRLYYIETYHQIMEGLCAEFGWDEKVFRSVYEKTIQGLKDQLYPKDFDPKKIII